MARFPIIGLSTNSFPVSYSDSFVNPVIARAPLFMIAKEVSNKVEVNYNLVKQKKELNKFIKDSYNIELNKHIEEILNLTYHDFIKLYTTNNVFNSVWSNILPRGFSLLNPFKGTRGIYGFMSNTGQKYVGSTRNLWQRLFRAHKTGPNKKAHKHGPFYGLIVQLGWEAFQLSIFCVLPDDLRAFKGKVLTQRELEILGVLNKYHLSIVEQFFLDNIQPSLNINPLSNASSYNKGRTEVLRNEEFTSNAFNRRIGCVYTEATKIKQSINMKGTVKSPETRAKISRS